MKNTITKQFEAQIHATLNEKTYISISWIKRGKAVAQSIAFESSYEIKEVTLSDNKTYLISYDSKRRDKVKMSLVENSVVTPCNVKMYQKESPELV